VRLNWLSTAILTVLTERILRTILLAGHDTTASTIAWWLWELAKSPEWQTRVRDEINTTRDRVTQRGDTDFSIADLEGMTMIHATLKVHSTSIKKKSAKCLLTL
jgi:alkylphenol/PAH-inducible cytochrome P450 monooxygenase